MKIIKKISILYIIIISIGFVTFTSFQNTIEETQYGRTGINTNYVTIAFELIKITDLPKEVIFNAILNVDEYSKILPNNIIYTKILSDTTSGFERIIFVEEKFFESGITSVLTIKHTFFDTDFHKVEIMSGDAIGTTIEQEFIKIDNGTKIKTEAQIKIKGILAPFGALTKGNMESGLDSALESFIAYAKKNT